MIDAEFECGDSGAAKGGRCLEEKVKGRRQRRTLDGSPGEDVEMGWLQEVGCVDGWRMEHVDCVGHGR